MISLLMPSSLQEEIRFLILVNNSLEIASALLYISSNISSLIIYDCLSSSLY